MLTKQEYLLLIPFEYIIGFSKETGLIRDNRCFTKKDFVHRLLANLKTSECKLLHEDYKNGCSYKHSVEWFLGKFPTGEIIGKNFVESFFRKETCYFEFPILKTRVDILRFAKYSYAYEVKSQRDKLDRLTYQVPALKSFFENVTLIIPSELTQTVMVRVDQEIGIVAFSSGNNHLVFEVVREPQMIEDYDVFSQLELLQVSELRTICFDNNGTVVKKSCSRKELTEAVIKRLDRGQINDLFKTTIQNRERLNREDSICDNGDLRLYL